MRQQTTYPANRQWRLPETNIDFAVADQKADVAFALNRKFSDPGAVKARLAENKTPWTVEDFAAVIKTGAAFVLPEPDGETDLVCTFCGEQFQPTRLALRDTKKGDGSLLSGRYAGPYLVWKSDRIAAAKDTFKDDPSALAAFEAVLKATTEALVSEFKLEMPAHTRAFPLCRACQEDRARRAEAEGYYPDRTYSRADAAMALGEIDAKIAKAIVERAEETRISSNRDRMNAIVGFGGRRREVESRPSRGDEHSHQHGYRNDNRPDRPEKTFIICLGGASLEATTVAKIQQAQKDGKVPLGDAEAREFLLANNGAQLLLLGIAHEKSFGPIAGQLRRAGASPAAGQTRPAAAETQSLRGSAPPPKSAPQGPRPKPVSTKVDTRRARKGSAINLSEVAG